MNVKRVKHILLATAVFVGILFAALVVTTAIGAIASLFVPIGYALLILATLIGLAAFSWVVAAEFVNQ